MSRRSEVGTRIACKFAGDLGVGIRDGIKTSCSRAWWWLADEKASHTIHAGPSWGAVLG